jgi:hypothetical protein
MVDHDPLEAEFAALRSALLIRPPGPDAVRRTVRRRRHRAIASAGALAVLAVSALALSAAGYVRPPQRTAAVDPSVSPSPTVPAVPHPVGSAGPARPSSSPGHTAAARPPASATSGPPCHRYGAVLLDSTTSSSVTVRVDQQGLYPLCPGERVRVFAATYSVDSNGVQHLFKSQVGYLDLGHNPVTVPYQTPPCHAIVYVMSGNQTIKQTIPATDNIYQDGPLVYGSPQWGPYNGVVWLHEQDPCSTT